MQHQSAGERHVAAAVRHTLHINLLPEKSLFDYTKCPSRWIAHRCPEPRRQLNVNINEPLKVITALLKTVRLAVTKVTSVCPPLPKFRPFTTAAPSLFRSLDMRRTASELPIQVVLTTGGDMMVQLLHEEITTECTVSSHILKQASAIFNAMLSKDRFQEGTDLSQSTEKSGLYTLKLHDDDAPAMLEILKALYYRGHQVSKRISFPDLVAIAELSEKYDLYEALYPWAQLWTPRVAHLAYDPGCEHWLLIAWAFREEKVFRELSRTVILELAAGSSLLLHPSLPDSVVGMYIQVTAIHERASPR